jgi:competence protein ComEC
MRSESLENSARHGGAELYQSANLTAAALGTLIGVLAVLYSSRAPPLPLALALLWIGTAMLVLRRRSHAWSAVAFAMLGYSLTAFHASDDLWKRWAGARDGERILADVIVETIPVSHGDAWSFDASVRGLNVRVISRDMSVRPRAGERWHLVLAMRAPKARVNPGAVDVERLYFRARIHALATVVKSRLNRRIDSGHRSVTRLREAAALRIERRIDDPEASALIQALAVGATGSMSSRQWEVFNATGTSHLVAISGLHVTLFATVAFFVSRRIWSGLLWRFTAWPRDNVAALMALAASFAYSLLAGLSVPTQRTLLMLSAWLLARSLARVSRPFGPLGLALIAVLLADPFAPLAPGFWLSFAAMAAIILATETHFVRRGLLHGVTTVQASVTAILAPFSLAAFGSLSAVGVAVNAIAIPLVSGVLVPTILLALSLMPLWPAGSDAVLDAAAGLHDLGWPWLAAAAEWPAAVLRLQPPEWWYPLAALGLAAAMLPMPLRVRLAAIAWLIPLALAEGEKIPERGFEVTVLDAGQGTAIVVRTARRALVYGTGEVYGTEGRAVENIVLPFLRRKGIDRVDALVLPRLAGPPSEGVTALLAAMPVESLLVCGERTANWRWDEVSFELGSECVLDIDSVAGRVRLQGRFVRSERWAVVSGRRPIEGREGPAWRRSNAAGVRVLTTDEGGAIRVLFDPTSGPGEPEPMRDSRPTLWR